MVFSCSVVLIHCNVLVYATLRPNKQKLLIIKQINKMTENKELSEEKQCDIHVVSSSFKVVMFANDTEFADYIQSKKPKEIWLDEFSKDEPYIIISSYYGNRLSGCYNHQTLLGANIDDCYWLFEDGMYVRNYC